MVFTALFKNTRGLWSGTKFTCFATPEMFQEKRRWYLHWRLVKEGCCLWTHLPRWIESQRQLLPWQCEDHLAGKETEISDRSPRTFYIFVTRSNPKLFPLSLLEVPAWSKKLKYKDVEAILWPNQALKKDEIKQLNACRAGGNKKQVIHLLFQCQYHFERAKLAF